MNDEKRALRKIFYARRQAVVQSHPEAVEQLKSNIRNWMNAHHYRCAGFYFPFRSEPDVTAALVNWMQETPGSLIAVPRVDDIEGGLMHYCRWSPEMSTVKGAFGIAEPQDDFVVEPDVIFSPCVAVDRQGFRLGNGGGFFDRYLADRMRCETPPVTVAVALDELIADDVCRQAHDLPFDWIATQSGFLAAKNRRTHE